MEIVITKEEAIQAWKDMNSHLRLDKDIKIKIQPSNKYETLGYRT